jgi:3'-phosphoadenosine 5'-phosphosulfate (PAPS) 3'-phosphatase
LEINLLTINRVVGGYESVETGAFEDTAGERKPLCSGTSGSDGLVAVASISHCEVETTAWLDAREVSRITSIGSSLKFCLLAAGEVDFYPRFGPTMEWTRKGCKAATGEEYSLKSI